MAQIKFGTVKIDSLKIIIPMSQVEVIDGKFNQKYKNTKLYESTGEVIEVYNRDTNTYSDEKGIKVKLEVCRIKFGNIGEKGFTGEEFLIFQPSSKFLKEIYFDGIGFNNLRIIHNYLLNLNVVRFSYESFLNARFCDVDFCIDFVSSKATFKAMIKIINSNVLASHQHLTRIFNKRDNLGLEFNKRKEATKTKPFLKFYHKSTELTQKSNEFYCEFLQTNYSETINNGIGRYEVTLKNAEFKKHYEVESMTVEELLNIPSAAIEIMFKKFLPNYLYKATIQKRMATTPTETIHLNCINQFIQDGKSEQEIMHLMLNGIEERSSLSRSKKVLEELFQEVKNPTKLAKNNESKKELNEALKMVGFYRDEEL
jgi:hypothetical protein